MIKRRTSLRYTFSFLLLLITGSCFSQPALAQIFPEEYLRSDYPVRPGRSFDIEHMDLSLTLEADKNMVRGSVTYHLRALREGQFMIRMRIADSAVDGVSWNGNEVNYEIRNDSLLIRLDEPQTEGNLSIIWQSTSKRALIRDHQGNFWNSLDPDTHHRWLPGYGFPGDSFTFEAGFTIPAEQTIVFNGKQTGSEIISPTSKTVRYRSDEPVNATDLSFVSGLLDVTEFTSGLTRLRMFYPANDADSISYQAMIREVPELKKNIESVLGRELPWPVVSVVMLPDSYLQERHHSSGMIRLFGSSEHKAALNRGVISQWIGTHHGSGQYYGSINEVTILQQFILRASGVLPGELHNPDDLYSLKLWNEWVRDEPSLLEEASDGIQKVINRQMRLPASMNAIDQYIEQIYTETGLSLDRLLPMSTMDEGHINNSEPRITNGDRYNIDVSPENADGSLELIFTLTEGEGEELQSFDIRVFGISDTLDKQVLITGLADTVVLSASGMVEYLTLSPYDNLDIGTYPDYFLAAALRSPDPVDRLFAARTLVTHADNPDLQLALNDAIGREANEQVKAALLEALQIFTGDAAGTEDKFLSNLRNSDKQLQLAALKGLSNYSGNERVIGQVRSVLLRTSDKEIFRSAVNTFTLIADSNLVASTVGRLIADPEKGWEALTALTMVDVISNETATGAAQRIIESSSHPFEVRSMALGILFNEEVSVEMRKDRIMDLYADPDPRIRLLLLNESMDLNRIQTLDVLNMARSREVHPAVRVGINSRLRQLAQ